MLQLFAMGLRQVRAFQHGFTTPGERSMRSFYHHATCRRGFITVGGTRSRVCRARARRHQPGAVFEVLEDRTLLSTLDITSGALTYDCDDERERLDGLLDWTRRD